MENDPVADPPRHDPPDPQVRIVDRRWWARQEGEEATDDGRARKPSYVEDLERQVAELTEQLRGAAVDERRSLDEFEQVKMRMRRDIGREVERGRRAVLLELLEVLDNLDRALDAARASAEAPDVAGTLTRGVELVRDQFLAKLAGFGVTVLPSLGQPFDAARHEAVTTTPVADPAQEGTVVAVMRAGYAIGDDILRPASVVVGAHG